MRSCRLFHKAECFVHVIFTMMHARQTGGASDFMKNSDLGDYVDAIIGPAPSGLTEGGYKKRGSIAVSKIDASGFYYLNVEGEPGHALKCILQVICRHLVAATVSLHVCKSQGQVKMLIGWLHILVYAICLNVCEFICSDDYASYHPRRNAR
jgi:hypothetical protein